MSGNRTSAGKITRAELDAQAIQLRKMGLTLKEVGAQMGVSGVTAHRRIKRILKVARDKLLDEVAEYQMLEDERLDAALKALWPEIVKGSPTAIGGMIKIMERRAKMLGLDGPIKIAPTDPTGEKPYDGTTTTSELLSRLDRIIATGGEETGA